MSSTPPPPSPALRFAATPGSAVSNTVTEVVQSLQQIQGQQLPPPPTMPLLSVANAEILGQDPELRRPLGPAGAAVLGAWTTALAGKQSLQIVKGSGQVAVAGSALPVEVAVRLTDGRGQPVAGVQVTFTRPSAGGGVASSSPITDTNGVASAGVWTLGGAAGIYTLEATTPGGASVKLHAVVVGPQVRIIRGDGQSGSKGADLPVEPAVRITDPFGQPAQGISVTFAVATGGAATVAGSSSVTPSTDSKGEVVAGKWKLGTNPGPNSLDVKVGGITVATFKADAI